jgi:hypothetical protein
MKRQLQHKIIKTLSPDQKQTIDDIFFGRGIDTMNRFPTFINSHKRYIGAEYWYALGLTYVNGDGMASYRKESKMLFQSKQPSRHSLMNDEELEIYNNLPDELTIYRGMTVEEYESGDWSISWTLDKSIADFFATKYIRNGKDYGKTKIVHEVKITKDQVIAYFETERELIVIF